jgi:hypothetical protein
MSDPVARAPRFNIRLSAEVRLEGRAVTGVTRNLSTGGVCIEIDRPIPENTQVRLTLFIVEDDIETEGLRGLEVSGNVQWAAEADRGWAIGLKFDPLSATQTTALTRALKAVGG